MGDGVRGARADRRPWLRFGEPRRCCARSSEIGSRDGLGDAAGRGLARAPRVVGQGSAAFAPHVKGLELPGYEPRTLQAMALGLAVNTRGADHNRSGAYEADLSGAPIGSTAARPHVAAAIETEDRAAVMDSLILCKFLRGVFEDPFPEWAACSAASPAGTSTADELEATARRIVLAKRAFNAREGWTRSDDGLPDAAARPRRSRSRPGATPC